MSGSNGATVFMGMDSPEIEPAVVADSLSRSRRGAAAYMCPATDGGYTLLALPPAAPNKVFRGVEWSTEQTCLSQANAIAACGIPVLFGPAFHDIDEIKDLMGLRHRLLEATAVATDAMQAAPGCPRVTACLRKYLPEGGVGAADGGGDAGEGTGDGATDGGVDRRAGLLLAAMAGAVAMWGIQRGMTRR